MRTFTRRSFLGRSAVVALVGPSLPKLAYDAWTEDDSAYLQRKIDALGPGETLKVKPRWYQVDRTLEVRDKRGVTISDLRLYPGPGNPGRAIVAENVHDTAFRNIWFDGFTGICIRL